MCAKFAASYPKSLEAVIAVKGVSKKYWEKGSEYFSKCDI